MKTSLPRSIVTILATLVVCTPAFAGKHYVVTELSTPAGGIYLPDAINDQGEVVGIVTQDTNRNWLSDWQDGQMQHLGWLRSFHNYTGRCINNHGQIAGECEGVAGNNSATHGFVLENGRMRDLGSLPIQPGYYYLQEVEPWGINELGQVVGQAKVSPYEDQAFIWENGKMINLDPDPNNLFSIPGLGAYPCTVALAINNRGQIIGCTNGREYDNGYLTGILWTKNGSSWAHPTITDLKGPDGSVFTPVAINDSGQIAGGLEGSGAAIWYQGSITKIDILDGFDKQAVHGMNELGDVVGELSTEQNKEHAFLWHGGQTFDINDLLPPDSGWVINSAFDINNYGQIVAWASHSEDDPDAIAVLLAPVEDVSIDFKPGDASNVINPRNPGLVEVAILTKPDFDARTVDVSSIRLAGVKPLSCRRTDVDKDKDTDLLLTFKASSLGLTKQTTEVTLTAKTVDGSFIEGTDSVVVR